MTSTIEEETLPIQFSQHVKVNFKREIYSLILVFLVICSFFIYTIGNFNNSSLTQTIYGNYRNQSDGTLYYIISLPKPPQYHHHWALYLDMEVNNGLDSNVFSIDAIFSSKQGKNKIKETRNSIPSVSSGVAELLKTEIPRQGLYFIQLLITGNVSQIISLKAILIESSRDYSNFSKVVQRRAFYLAVIVFSIYLVAFASVGKQSIKVSHFFVLLSLLLSVFATYPDVTFKTGVTKPYCASLIVRGAFSGLNLVALFAISYSIIGGETVVASLIIACVFVLSEAMRYLTSDTSILSEIFENNGIIWVFFFSISILTKVSIILMIINHLFFAFKKFNGKNRQSIAFYLFFATISIIPRLMHLFYLAMYPIVNYLFEYFCEMVSGLISSVVMAILFWPQYSNQSERSDSQHLIEEKFQISRDPSLVSFDHLSDSEEKKS